jgi:PEP-CTERM motif
MIKSALIGAALVAFASPAVAATTITFNDIAVSPSNAIVSSAVSSGFTFTGAHFHIIDASVNFAPTAGGTFSLNQADIAELFLAGNGFGTVTFTGTVSGGGSLTKTFTLDGIRDGLGGVPDFQTALFTGWNNLTTVNITGNLVTGAPGDWSIDNILVNATPGAVPEPATWGLMLAGFGIVGGAMRRRQHILVSRIA